MAIPHPREIQLAVVNWLDERYPFTKAVDEALYQRVPNFANAFYYCFGGMVFILIVLQLLTGILLALYYVPDAGVIGNSPAYNSVNYIQSTRLPRLADPRRPFLGRQHPDHHGPDPHGQGLLDRVVPSAARAELDGRHHHAAGHPGVLAQRLPAALGHQGLLRHRGHDQDRRLCRRLRSWAPSSARSFRAGRSSARPRCSASSQSTCSCCRR